MKENKTEKLLEKDSIKYVVVPYDSLGEIFQKDRKYDSQLFDKYIKDLQKIPYLKQDISFQNLAVFQTKKHDEHMNLENSGNVTYAAKESDLYIVTITSSGSNLLLFNDNYSPEWNLQIGDSSIKPTRTADGLMTFGIPKGKYQAVLSFSQKNWYVAGFIISFVSLIILLVLYFVLQYKNFFVYLKNTF